MGVRGRCSHPFVVIVAAFNAAFNATACNRASLSMTVHNLARLSFHFSLPVKLSFVLATFVQPMLKGTNPFVLVDVPDTR